MKKTPWFPGTVKPVHVGVYERKYPVFKGHIVLMSYWNGYSWCLGGTDAYTAFLYRQVMVDSEHPWRGLAKKP